MTADPRPADPRQPIVIPVPPALGVDARGRNGWFRPAELQLTCEPAYTAPDQSAWYPTVELIELHVSSNRPTRDWPPLLLRLDPASARALAEALQVQAERVEAAQATAAGRPRLVSGIRQVR